MPCRAPATPETYTLALHDALPISGHAANERVRRLQAGQVERGHRAKALECLGARWVARLVEPDPGLGALDRSSEDIRMERLQQAPQSRLHLPCGLLRLERQASERFGNRAAGGGIVILRQSIEQRPCDQRRLRW